MTSPLRSRVVEAGARALWASQYDEEPYIEIEVALSRQMSEAALDAMLDCLTENADETVHVRFSDITGRTEPWRLGDTHLEDLLAVLRNPDALVTEEGT